MSRRTRSRPLNLLIVDDSADGRRLVAEYLASRGFVIHLAGSGAEALALARKVRPDIVLIDLRMPGVDAWKAGRALKNDAATHAIILIAVAAQVLRPETEAARDASCDGVIFKPFDLATLADALPRLINHAPAVLDVPGLSLNPTSHPKADGVAGRPARHERRIQPNSHKPKAAERQRLERWDGIGSRRRTPLPPMPLSELPALKALLATYPRVVRKRTESKRNPKHDEIGRDGAPAAHVASSHAHVGDGDRASHGRQTLKGKVMERRQHDRLTRPGRRQTDRRPPLADNRRVLLAGPDEAWRLLTTYVFEEAGYAVYAAADQRQTVVFTTRMLPDVVVVQMEAHDTLDVLARLSEGSSTSDIQVVVLTSSLHSAEARRAREAGGVTLLAHSAKVDVLVGAVDRLIATAPRAQRTLKRRLLDLQELARYYKPDAEGQKCLRNLIDRLQVAILAVDDHGHCIAASPGATMLTGYTRRQLLTTSLFQAGFACGRVSDQRWRDFLASRQYAGTTTIKNRSGENVKVHAAAVAEIMPGFHVAAFGAA